MFPLKVQRGAVRRGLRAPQAAPGLRKPGEPQGRREGGGGERQAGAGRRRRRPPAQREEAEDRGRQARPPPQDAATMDGGPDLSRPRAGRGAGRPGAAREAAVASRSRFSRRRPRQPRHPARSRAALAGAPRRRGDNGGRQSAGAARAPSPSPRRVNPFAAPAAPGQLTPQKSPPTTRPRPACDLDGLSHWALATETRCL